MAKDLVGPTGSDINKKDFVFIDINPQVQIRIQIKAAAFNDALRTALGYKATATAGKHIQKETHKEALQDHSCLPLTLEYEDDDGGGGKVNKFAKVIAAPDVDLTQIAGKKYHGTLNIVGYRVGH